MTGRTADQIREAIEQSIVTGEFSDGDRLSEVSLANRFGVSRTPLREALQVLSASGLVELVPNRGAFVRHPDFVELVEMFEVMAELEALCGERCARRIGDGQLEQLEDTIVKCEAALATRDTDEYYRENEKFHMIIYDACGNGFLASQARQLHRRLRPFRRMQLQLRGRMPESMREHHEIVEALREGNATLAADALRDHVSIQGNKFNDLMASYKAAALELAE